MQVVVGRAGQLLVGRGGPGWSIGEEEAEEIRSKI